MAKKTLHPSVEQFKQFVKANPNLVKEVRTGKNTLQELFEDWYLLGEDDPRWNSLRDQNEHANSVSEEKKPDWMANIMGSLKKVDPNQMQGYIQNISQALTAVQGVISQFQGGSQISPPKSGIDKPNNPFVFKKD